MAGRKVFAPATVLTAADVNNFLMDQAVMVFVDSAARASAIPTPTEGMVTYLEDTNALEVFTGASFVPVAEEADLTTLIPKSTVTTAGDLIVADGAGSVTRLGIGAADTVLTSDGTTLSFEAAGGGGGLTEISSVTISGASVTFSSIPQTFNKLYLVITEVTSSFLVNPTFSQPALRINTDTGANYAHILFTSAGVGAAINKNEIELNTFEPSFEYVLATVLIPEYTQSIETYVQFTVCRFSSATNIGLPSGQGFHNSAAAVTSLTFFDMQGNSFTGGTATLFGVN